MSGPRTTPRDHAAVVRQVPERLVTVGGYEGRPQRVHIATRTDNGMYVAYQTLCGFYATDVGTWVEWMRFSEADAATCKRCLTKAAKS